MYAGGGVSAKTVRNEQIQLLITQTFHLHAEHKWLSSHASRTEPHKLKWATFVSVFTTDVTSLVQYNYCNTYGNGTDFFV